MSVELKNQLFLVGAGKMGGALLEGWVAQGVDPQLVSVLDPGLASGAGALIQERQITLNPDLDNQARAEVVVLAIKPQIMGEVLPTLLPLVDKDTMVLSIMAGCSLAAMAKYFDAGTAIIRAMPNTPAAIGRGMSAAVPNGHVSPGQKQLADMLLGAVGLVEWIDDEALMDAVTALSGSGPAYVFHLAECMAKAGEALGLEQKQAMRLARQTVIGSGELMNLSQGDAAALRENVTSPGGTTEAALEVLMQDQALEKLMHRAMKAAARRSAEL